MFMKPTTMSWMLVKKMTKSLIYYVIAKLHMFYITDTWVIFFRVTEQYFAKMI